MKKLLKIIFTCLFLISIVITKAGVPEISSSINALSNHLNGNSPLSAATILNHAQIIKDNAEFIDDDQSLIDNAFNLIDLYDNGPGPIFISNDTKNGISATNHSGTEIHWALFQVQQAIVDFLYTSENINSKFNYLYGKHFETSKYFPGWVNTPSDSSVTYQVEINGTNPKTWGKPVSFVTEPVRRPTGTYLPPGTIAEITIPSELIDKGLKIRVGVHSWDHIATNKPTLKRLARVSKVYDITSEKTKVANPLGGGIYIEIPYQSYLGIINISIKNVVRSPFFSARDHDKMTNLEWINEQRNLEAPWADFESEKYMMNLPTSWIYNLDDPVHLMKEWDLSMDIVSDLLGYPRNRGKTVLYDQVDVDMRGSANFPGYPQANWTYNPNTTYNGKVNHLSINGPQTYGYNTAVVFHELGHAQLFTKFRGETEAVVNLLYIPVLNKGFGVSLDSAFGRSVEFDKGHVGKDQAAISWMMTDGFRSGNEMISSGSLTEMAYQHRGFGKYVEVAYLFGWKAVEDFFYEMNLLYEAGDPNYPSDQSNHNVDDRIYRMSKNANADLRPLVHFWGIHPLNDATLKLKIHGEGHLPSAKIYDQLVYYKSIIPKNNREFKAHAEFFEKGVPNTSSTNNLTKQYVALYNTWNESYYQTAYDRLQWIIDYYFPNGRPEDGVNCTSNPIIVNIGNDITTCSGKSIPLNSTVSGGTAPYQYQWSDQLGTSVTATATPTSINAYKLTITDANGCKAADEVYVKIDNTSTLDNCNTCVGGSTGQTACNNDCQGVLNGTAFKDNCGTCVGGTTGLTACTQDCNGDWGGTASPDDCGICSGGVTGITPNTTQCCYPGNTITAEKWTGISGTSVNDIPLTTSPSTTYTDNNLDFSFTDHTLGVRVRAYLCPPTTGNYTFWIASDDNGEIWLSTDEAKANLVKLASVDTWVNYQNYDDFASQKSTSIYLEAGKKYYFELLYKENQGGAHYSVAWQVPGKARSVISAGYLNQDPDCNGILGGGAYYDNCNICVGGNTGKSACNLDCNGEANGTAYFDKCSVCVGGNTGKLNCTPDCNGEYGGNAYYDNCNVCVAGKTGLTPCIQDCNGDYGGFAYLDDCEVCVAGNTGKFDCNYDCEGIPNGRAYLDDCEICVSGYTSKVPCIEDCNGDLGGTAYMDSCGVCAGGNTNKVPCIMDCQGVWGGTDLSSCCYPGNLIEVEQWDTDGHLVSDIPINLPPLKVYKTTKLFEDQSTLNILSGRRIQGWICAPVSGDYTFYMYSRRDSEFYLSTDENESNKQLIIKVDEFYSGAFGTYPERFDEGLKSTTIYLEAGKKYYFDYQIKTFWWARRYYDIGWKLPGSSNIKTITSGHITQKIDCENIIGGTAYFDDCDECVGGNTNKTACVVTAIKDNSNTYSVNIFPNPSQGLFDVTLNTNESVKMTLIDVSGKVIYSEVISSHSETIQKQLDLSNHPTGTYYLKVSSDSINQIEKISLIK